MGQESVVHLRNGILHRRKKEGVPTLCDSMDGTEEHYGKLHKPGGERQISYDLTYKWNLNNKANKWAKYKEGHWNIDQTDHNQRGGGWCITGERRRRVIKEHV